MAAPRATRATANRSTPAAGLRKCLAGSNSGALRQFKLRGTKKVAAVFGLHLIAYNLIRLGNLIRPAAMEAACAAHCPEVWPDGRPKPSETARMDIIQLSNAALRAEINKKSAFGWEKPPAARGFFRKHLIHHGPIPRGHVTLIRCAEADPFLAGHISQRDALVNVSTYKPFPADGCQSSMRVGIHGL
jgi:hypothetical protein